jgi:carbon-monoxide dehydrogenase catalytic subunit
MDLKNYTSIEQMEAEAAKLKENAAGVGAETWEDRKKNQTPSCKFGEDGICCRICSMGPCRITPKAPRGICGATAGAIAGRNYLRMIVGGASAHSDHGREICHVLHTAKPDGNYKVKDEAKLLKLANEWGIATEGKDIYEIAHEVAVNGLMEFGKPFGTLHFIDRAIDERKKVWEGMASCPARLTARLQRQCI